MRIEFIAVQRGVVDRAAGYFGEQVDAADSTRQKGAFVTHPGKHSYHAAR